MLNHNKRRKQAKSSGKNIDLVKGSMPAGPSAFAAEPDRHTALRLVGGMRSAAAGAKSQAWDWQAAPRPPESAPQPLRFDQAAMAGSPASLAAISAEVHATATQVAQEELLAGRPGNAIAINDRLEAVQAAMRARLAQGEDADSGNAASACVLS